LGLNRYSNDLGIGYRSDLIEEEGSDIFSFISRPLIDGATGLLEREARWTTVILFLLSIFYIVNYLSVRWFVKHECKNYTTVTHPGIMIGFFSLISRTNSSKSTVIKPF